MIFRVIWWCSILSTICFQYPGNSQMPVIPCIPGDNEIFTVVFSRQCSRWWCWLSKGGLGTFITRACPASLAAFEQTKQRHKTDLTGFCHSTRTAFQATVSSAIQQRSQRKAPQKMLICNTAANLLTTWWDGDASRMQKDRGHVSSIEMVWSFFCWFDEDNQKSPTGTKLIGKPRHRSNRIQHNFQTTATLHTLMKLCTDLGWQVCCVSLHYNLDALEVTLKTYNR